MNTSNIEEDIEGEGPWFVYKRNACDAIRIITYENAKEILNINNTNTNIYMLHGDFDAKVKDNIHNFSDILKNFDEEYSIYTTDDEKQYIKNIFGNKKDLYEENYISFCQKHSMNLIIPKDNGSFLIKSEFQNIIPNDFDFKKELIDDAEGDTIWMLMDKKNFKELLPSDSNGYIIFKFVDKESQSQFITTWNVYKYLIEPIQCLSNVPREERSIKTWGLNEEPTNEREYLRILLGKTPENIHVPLSETGKLLQDTTNILNTSTYQIYNPDITNLDDNQQTGYHSK